MGIFTEIRNEALIRELKHELNTDVLLFGFDGFTYFGNLQAVENNRIAVLTPAIEASTSDVEILTPGGELRRVDFARVDLWQVVGKGTGVVSDPIYSSESESATALPVSNNTARLPEDEIVERQESHCLIQQLKKMIGDDVTITTLGGFLFEGVLGDVCNELAIIRVEEIFVPGTSESISDGDVRSVVVNLEALTSVSSPAGS